MKHTSQSPQVCPGERENADTRTIIPQPTPTNIPIKNGPEMIDFRAHSGSPGSLLEPSHVSIIPRKNYRFRARNRKTLGTLVKKCANCKRGRWRALCPAAT